MLKRVGLLLCVVVGFALGFMCDALICRVPKESVTQTSIRTVETAVRNFYTKNGHLPKSLSELPEAGEDGFAIDGWRNSLKYVARSGTVVTITADIPTFCGSGIVHTFTRTFDCAKGNAD